MNNVFTYELDDNLYINLTNRCTNACTFCIRNEYDGLGGYTLWLDKEPTAEEIIKEIPDPQKYPEIVFCGYGEPTARLEVLKEVAQYIKEKGGKTRLNTNGHGNVINKRNIVPELKGLIDIASVSLNAGTKEEYDRVSVPSFDDAFNAVKEFIKESVSTLPETIATVVKVPGDPLDIEAASKLAEELGAQFRVRIYE
jgi:TatD DNase family protein